MKNFIINLDRRPDRWAITREHFHNNGIQVTRFTGIPNKIGWKGCLASHLVLIGMNKNEVAFGIYEDDCEFIGDLNLLEVAIRELPSNWDLLYLGASPQEPQERYSDHLFSLKNAWTTHAIIYHTRVGGAVEYILNHNHDQKWDVFLAKEIQPNFNCFITYPILATQREGYRSDTTTAVDVSTIVKNYNKYCI